MTFHILLPNSSDEVCAIHFAFREIYKPAQLMLNRTLQREQLEMKDIKQHAQNSPKNKLESIWHTATQASPASLLLRPRATRMRDR